MNHYEVLGIKKTATQNEIREAYKKLVKKYHPDLYQGDKTFAEKKTQSINAAYEVLSDPELREKYDDEITPKTYSPNNSTNYNYNTNYSTQRNNSAYSYDNYRRNNSGQYSTYNDFYQRRYSNYHRSKVPNSNYTNYSHSRQNKSFFELIFKTSKQQIIAVIIIFIIYLVTLVSNITEYSSNYKNVKNESSNYTNSYDNDRFYSDYKDFDVNDYYSDSELYDIYEKDYADSFSSFEEFKEVLSQYLYIYIYNND